MELASEAAAIAISTVGTAAVKLSELEAAWNVRMQAGVLEKA
jgi:bifunctional ADP-heptose synthase (sugar kinase/adenylyltransferase)